MVAVRCDLDDNHREGYNREADGENAGMYEEDEDEDEVSSPNAHSSSARKRKPPSVPQSDHVRPSKKVAFAGITTQSKKQVPLSNKRTNPPLAHGKGQKTATLSPKKANPGVRSTRAPAGAA